MGSEMCIRDRLAPIVQDGDVVLTMGAGSIGRASKQLFEQLAGSVTGGDA